MPKAKDFDSSKQRKDIVHNEIISNGPFARARLLSERRMAVGIISKRKGLSGQFLTKTGCRVGIIFRDELVNRDQIAPRSGT
jgi:hypothetical protein